MATGFVQRFKGKIAVPVGGIYIGGVQVNAAGADFNSIVGMGTLQALTTASTTSTLTASGVTTIAATSAAAIFRLPKPFAGAEKTIMLTTVSSSVFITASTDGSVLINGSSINTTLKSTVAMSLALMGNSTAAWTITGFYSTTAGAGSTAQNVVGPALSTST